MHDGEHLGSSDPLANLHVKAGAESVLKYDSLISTEIAINSVDATSQGQGNVE